MTFDKNIRQRSVSYDGDSFNPTGTITGGSRNAKQSVLVAIANLQRVTSRLEVEATALAQLRGELKAVQESGKQFGGLHKKHQLLQHSLQMLEAQAANSEFGALQAKAAELEEVRVCCFFFCLRNVIT